MVQEDKAITPASDLAWILEYTMQTIFRVCTLLMVASMMYKLETLHLRKILNGEPTGEEEKIGYGWHPRRLHCEK